MEVIKKYSSWVGFNKAWLFKKEELDMYKIKDWLYKEKRLGKIYEYE